MASDNDVLNFVQSLMERDGITKTELATRLGTGRATVHNWWKRLKKIPDDWYARLGAVFGVHEDDIRTAGSGVVVIRHAGDRIRFLRKAQDLTETEVANLLGITVDEYATIERQGTLPSTAVFLELTKVIQAKNPHWLVHGDPVIRKAPAPGSNNGSKQKPQEGAKR